MIATRRGLAALLAIAALLGVLLARELRRTRPPPEDRALVPGLDPSFITAMTWDRSPLPPVTVSGQGTLWTWTSTSFNAVADSRVVHDVLAALRAGRWQRTGEVAAAGKLRAQLSVTIGTNARVIGIGEALPGTEQTWLVVGDRALLVDSWVARALDPAPLALRERKPVVDAAHAPVIIIYTATETSRFESTPPRQLLPRVLLVRAPLMAELARALDAIEIMRLSRSPATVQYLTINVGNNPRLSATCPDDPALAWLSSDIGDGCIARASYDEVVAAASALTGPAEAVTEPRPLPVELEAVVLADGGVLALDRAPAIDGKPADPVAVAELLAVLAAPAELVPLPEPHAVRGKLTLTVRKAGAITLELLGGNLVHRESEPLALRLSGGAYARLARGAKPYADKSVWNEEPTTITSIKIDGVTYTRGAVIGEWTRVPAGAFDPKRVEAVVAAIAAPRRTPDVESINYTHRVALIVTPPVGEAVVHELAVGNFRCIATSSTATMGFPSSVCDALDALAR